MKVEEDAWKFIFKEFPYFRSIFKTIFTRMIIVFCIF